MLGTDNVIEVVVRVVDEATGKLKGLVGAFSGLRGVVAGVLGGLTLKALIGNMIEAETVAKQLDVAFKNMGEGLGFTRRELDEMASSLQRTTTFSDESVKSAQKMVLSFKSLRGEAFERTIRVAADLAAYLGQDIPQAAQTVGRALESPARGMLFLRRAGIVLSEQTQKTIKDFVKLGETSKAQEVLLRELESRMGGTAAAMRDTLGGALTGLKNAVGDIFEGDSSSFAGATKAINDFSAALGDPKFKANIDSLITGLFRIGEGMALIIGRAPDLLNALDRMTGMPEFFKDAPSPIQALTDKIAENEKELTAAAKRVEKAKKQLERPALLRNVTVGAVKEAATSGTMAPLIDDERFKKELKDAETKLTQLKALDKEFRSARASLLTKQVPLVGKEPPKPAAGATEDEPPPDLSGLTAQLKEITVEAAKIAETAVATVEREIREKALPQFTKDAAAWAEAEAEAWAGYLSALGTKTEIPVEQFRERLKEIGEQFLEPIEITVRKIEIPRIEFKQSELVIQAARNIQTAFSSAFLRIDEGWKGFVNGVLDGLEQILAEAAALNLAKAMGLDDVLAGKKATGGVGKLLEKLFPASQTGRPVIPAPEKPAEATIAAARVERPAEVRAPAPVPERTPAEKIPQVPPEVVVKSVLPEAKTPSPEPTPVIVDAVLPKAEPIKVVIDTGDLKLPEPEKAAPPVIDRALPPDMEKAGNCAAECASEVVSEVSSTMGGSVQTALDKLGAGITGIFKPIFGGLWKFITDALKGLWQFLSKAVAAITRMASAGGGGDDWLGMVTKAVGAVVGGGGFAAGGGRIPANQPTTVGEEGTEVIVPEVPSRVMNQRQLAFAGATGGGGTVNFAPEYNIAITGAKDDKAMFGQLAAYIERRDQQTKLDMMEMMRRNGFGRMRR